MRVDNFLSSDAFTIVNKKLAKKLWLWKAVYLQELIAQRRRFKQDEFYFTRNNMEEELGINSKSQQRYATELKDLWLITIERKWLPARNYYTINDDLICEVITSSDKMSTLEETKSPDYSYISNNDKEEDFSSNEENKVEQSGDLNSLAVSEEKEKEKSSAQKEKERKAQVKKSIDNFIACVKDKCDELWVMYDKDMEREFSRHILTAKEFWENAEKCGMDRITFALNILKASVDIAYYRWPCNWPKAIYQNYVSVYNQTRQKHQKQNNLIWFLPWLNIW